MKKIKFLKVRGAIRCFFMILFGMICCVYLFSQQPCMHPNGRYLYSASAESVFLHTDRSDYSPGESIFFKAYLLNDKPGFQNHPGETLYVTLTDEEGLDVASGKFLVENSSSSGYIVLSRSLTEGNYILMASADFMKSTSPDMIFSKIIEVKKLKKPGIATVITLNDTLYIGGSRLEANISISGKNETPVSTAFTYRLIGREGEIISGKDRTKNDGRARLGIQLPLFQNNDTLRLMVTSSFKGTSFSSGIVIPTPGNHKTLRSYNANNIDIDNCKSLNIRIRTDKDHYMAGEKVNVNINVTDDKGIPVSAHLSVSASNLDPQTNLLQNYINMNGKEMPGGQMGVNPFWRNAIDELQIRTLPETVRTELADKEGTKQVFNRDLRNFFADCLYIISHSPGSSFVVHEKNNYEKIRKEQVSVKHEVKYGYRADLKITDIIYHIKPFLMEGGKIVFANSGVNSFYYQDGALIVIDGIKMGTDAEILNSIPVTDIAIINVYTNPSDIQRYTGLNSVGVIEINTKKGNEEAENKSRVSEARSGALLWEPDILTDGSGNARASFINSSSEVIITVAVRSVDGFAGISSVQLPVK